MTEEISEKDRQTSSLWILAMVNSGIWAISLIALVFVMRHSPSAKGLFPILAGGTAVAVALLSVLRKDR
jgi:hypothetical protein